MEESIVPNAGFELKLLPVRGLPRSISPALFKSAGRLLISLKKAAKILNSFQPDAVIGTGGYAAGPIVLRSVISRRVTLLHEQNLVPGLTNRLLAPYVDRVCLSFPESKKYFSARVKLSVTGNPRASEIVRMDPAKAKKKLGFDPQKPLLVVVGGSRGAAVLNRVFCHYLLKNQKTKLFQVFYITGFPYYDAVNSELAKHNLLKTWHDNLRLVPFYQDMPLVWSAADLAICRSGATTLAEITAAGTPSLLVPSPNVVHDHQNLNAKLLQERRAALVVQEKDFTPEFLAAKLHELLSYPVLLREMRQKSLAMGVPDAAERLYRCLIASISQKRNN